MAACMTFRGRAQCLAKNAVVYQSLRFRWKPPNKNEIIYPSYAQRLAEWNSRYEAPASQGVNIGFHFSKGNEDGLETVKKWMKSRKSLEHAARHKKLHVDLEKVKQEWNKESMPLHLHTVAEHYGIFKDLFDGAHFFPIVPLDVHYDYDEEFVTPVRYGNVIPAAETSVKPFVSYEAPEDSLWTLVMSSPDGNLEDSKKELLHWCIGNIPGSDIQKAETVCAYLQPFPPKGVGFLRYVFVLYKQNKRLDFQNLQKTLGSMSLRERSFSTLDFYREHEEDLTPTGLAFFQSEWDKSITSVFHHVLDMKEPVFEFIHPPRYVEEQKEFPHRQPFNLYLDQYRDIKDIQEEVLREKLKTVDPSKPPPPKPEFPAIDLLPQTTPSWLKMKIQRKRLGTNQWKDFHKTTE